MRFLGGAFARDSSPSLKPNKSCRILSCELSPNEKREKYSCIGDPYICCQMLQRCHMKRPFSKGIKEDQADFPFGRWKKKIYKLSCFTQEIFKVTKATYFRTRMHSSRMRTGRTLTVFRKLENSPKKFGGTPPPRKFGGPPGKIGDPPKNWSPPEKLETPPRDQTQTPPPLNRMTDRCKNITLAKTSFRPVMNYHLYHLQDDLLHSLHWLCPLHFFQN